MTISNATRDTNTEPLMNRFASKSSVRSAIKKRRGRKGQAGPKVDTPTPGDTMDTGIPAVANKKLRIARR